jgi:hypothetical protein
MSAPIWRSRGECAWRRVAAASLGLLVFFGATPALCQATGSGTPAQAQLSLSRDQVRIGQPFELVIELALEPGQRLLPPEVTLPPEVVRSAFSVQSEERGGVARMRYRLQLHAEAEGAHSIGPVGLTSMHGGPLDLPPASLAAIDLEVVAPTRRGRFVLGGLAAVTSLSLLGFAWRRRSRANDAPPPAPDSGTLLVEARRRRIDGDLVGALEALRRAVEMQPGQARDGLLQRLSSLEQTCRFSVDQPPASEVEGLEREAALLLRAGEREQ